MTDHRAIVYLYHMQDTSNVLTRWAIALHNFDFTVKYAPGKLSVVPDNLSRVCIEIESKPIMHERALASICRNLPVGQPYRPATPREFEITASTLENVERVQDYREVFTSAVLLFRFVDPVAILESL